jgi:hypothetical protein
MITRAVSGMESSKRFFRSFSSALSISSEIESVNRLIIPDAPIDAYRRKRYK